jgi:hypothetical protein
MKVSGTASEVEEALAYLEYRPACILDRNNSLEIDFTISNEGIMHSIIPKGAAFGGNETTKNDS